MARNQIKAILLTTVDATTVTFLTPLNPNGLDEACFRLRIHNRADQPLFVSFDGVDPHDVIHEDGGILDIPGRTQSQFNSQELLWRNLLVIYGTYVIPPSAGGQIHIAGYYYEK